MLNEVGLFDEDFRMYLEDVDLSFRARLKGHRCVCVPQARVKHHGAGTTGSQYHRNNVFFIARNTVFVLLKNMPKRNLFSHFFRIAGFMIYLQTYHTFKTFHAWACMKGIFQGLRHSGKMVNKRKRILGGKRVTTRQITDMLLSCEAEYRRLKREKAK